MTDDTLQPPAGQYPVKTPTQIAAMRRAGRVVAEMHAACRRVAQPGATTADLAHAAAQVLAARRATSNFLGYFDFPAIACVSVNEEIAHGIPGDRTLLEGDIVSIDLGAIVDGWHGDAAVTLAVGEIDDDAARLIEYTEAALSAAITAAVVGGHLGDIGAAIEDVARCGGYSIVDGLAGHGIGTAMHEAPTVENVGVAGSGLELLEGMVLAFEPMFACGGPETRECDNGWTVVTADGLLSAHFEHSVAITADGPEILTRA